MKLAWQTLPCGLEVYMTHTPLHHSHTADASAYPVDIEKLLREGHPIRLNPQGYSMYPLFIPGRDEAVIAPCSPDTLHRGDVALYRRDESILVLHRIWKIREDGFYMVGDNQTAIEGPLRPDQIHGKLIACCRNGREFSTENRLYRILSGLWLWFRPFRPLAHKAADLVRHIRRRQP